MNRESMRVVRKLTAAEGYLELDLPQLAHDELDASGEAGPYDAIRCLLRGEAYKAQGRYERAISPLSRAAQLFPAPHCRRAWQALGECYYEQGQLKLAEAARKAAEVCQEVARTSADVVKTTLTIQFQITIRRS